MTLMCISYDKRGDKNYQPLWDELDRLGAHKALESFYLLSINNTALEIKDHLSQYVDDNDFLMVISFVDKPRFKTAMAGTNNWINRHFP